MPDFEIDTARRRPMHQPRRYSDLAGPEKALFDAQLAAYEAGVRLAQRSGAIAKAQQVQAARAEAPTGAPTAEAHHIDSDIDRWAEMRGRYRAAFNVHRDSMRRRGW